MKFEGVSPSMISVENGDTPVHAALIIALDKDKGNFSLLDKLLDLYKSNGQKYAYLDPKRVNRLGDTLLHTACRCKYNKHSHKAVELLCNQQVPTDILNKEGKMAIECLRRRNDRRAQFLRVFGRTAQTKSAEPQEKIQPRKSGTKAMQTMADFKQSSPYGIDNITDHRVKAVNLDRVAKSRGRIRKILIDRSDPQISMNKRVITEDIFWQSRSKLKQDDGQSEEDSKKKIVGSSRRWIKKENRTVAKRLLKEDEKLLLNGADEDEEVEVFDVTTISFDNMPWEVECTAEVKKCLQDKHVPPELKRKAACKIQFLAKGDWRPHLNKPINNVPSTLKLFEAKLSKAARIIWEVAVPFTARCNEEAEKGLGVNKGQELAAKGGRIYSEVIRIWDIVFDHDNLFRSIQKIVRSHKQGKTCVFKKELKKIKNSNLKRRMTEKYPMLFVKQDDDVSAESVRDMQQLLLFPPASGDATEYHIHKFYSFSNAFVILNDIEVNVDFPFRGNDQEHAIINLRSKSPILLIGRSGTGKTICCLYRLWDRFLSYWIKARNVGKPLLPRAKSFIIDKHYNDEDVRDAENEDIKWSTDELQIVAADECNTMDKCLDEEDESDETESLECDHLHQIFVTKNPVLCSEIHKTFYQFCNGRSETSHHKHKKTEELPPRIQDIDYLSYPLFVTSKQLLLMLDASLDPPYFFDRNKDGSLVIQVQGWGAKDDFFTFSHMSDSGDEKEDDDNEEEELLDEDFDPVEYNSPTHQRQIIDQRREVTYEVFYEQIWPKIIKKMSVNYHPSLVWTEIMSFIKGSVEAVSKPEGHLSKDEYVELGRKRAPSFSGERDKVYELYKKYEHLKKQKLLFDESDVVQNIYRRLGAMTVQPWVFHQLYVDETQDFTQAELCVLLRLSQNPNDMFLTGDTAQSIMKGISFRFSDLRSLFFYARKSLHARGQIRTINVPKQIYQLTHNYRSHAGILSLASAVLDLMVEFFPESFDQLQKDQGLFHGPLPILLEFCSLVDLSLLLEGNKRKTSHIEFGAHQAILVRNDSVKNNMPEELSHGIVLTIHEAKGLEFDDVLLYNFFKDSQASNEWRVVRSFLDKIARTVAENNSNVAIDKEILKRSKRSRTLTFDWNQHKVLNSELKHLYTALTRARVNLWIFDEDDKNRAAMFEYFKALKLVRCITQQEMDATGAKEAMMFAEISTPEEWTKRGDKMMGRCLYEVAAKCYRMGNKETKEKIALAHNKALKASRMKDNPKKMREEFVFAAEKYLEIGHNNKAAICLQNAKEYELAALVFEKCGQLVEAIRMYCRCMKHLDVSRCYEQLGNNHKAVEVLDNEELYDQAIDCLERYKLVVSEYKRKGQEVPRVLLSNKPGINFTVARLSFKAANFYHKYKNESKMLEALERLPLVVDRLDFLEKRGYVEQAATILLTKGKTREAAQMMLPHRKIEKVPLCSSYGLHFVQRRY